MFKIGFKIYTIHGKYELYIDADSGWEYYSICDLFIIQS